jgi:hypothetical protein
MKKKRGRSKKITEKMKKTKQEKKPDAQAMKTNIRENKPAKRKKKKTRRRWKTQNRKKKKRAGDGNRHTGDFFHFLFGFGQILHEKTGGALFFALSPLILCPYMPSGKLQGDVRLL